MSIIAKTLIPPAVKHRWNILFSAFSSGRASRRKDSLWQRLSGSLTIEASIAFSITILLIAVMYMWFSILGFRISLNRIMQEIAGQSARYCLAIHDIGILNDDETGMTADQNGLVTELVTGIASVPILTNLIVKRLEDEGVDFGLIHEGNQGLSFIGSGYNSNSGIVQIVCSYRFSSPLFDFFGISIPCVEFVQVRAWIGKSMEKEESEQFVYITESGEAYHTSLSCSYLNITVKSISRDAVSQKRNRDGKIYYACEYCDEGISEMVYFTDYGTKYHTDRYCIALKRTILTIPISQVGNRRCCKKCGE